MAYYPKLRGGSMSRSVADSFRGYEHRLRNDDGVTRGLKTAMTFYETENLTTRYAPLMAPRGRRGVMERSFSRLQAIIAKDALYWVDNGTLYANGYPTGLTGLQTKKETQLVSMGAYICVFPDKKYLNTQDLTDYGSMGADWHYSGKVTYTMCHADGTTYERVSKGPTEPAGTNGDIWIDTTSNSVKEYSSYTAAWVVIETVYTRVDFTSMGQIPKLFKELDGVEVSGMGPEDLNGSKIIYALGGDSTTPDFVVLVGIQDTQQSGTASIRIQRTVPDMDYVCEAQNRLWGCFYGNDGTQNLNEIYCCALGDFRNWSQYLGIATDSWRASRGSDGPFTGCINYLGTPTFFKENVIHAVTVSTSGAHQIGDLPARGVQQGSHKSLAIVNETLYYKARSAIMAYQGGMPIEVSEALGDERYYKAVAGVFGSRYYTSMQDAPGTWQLFCYDASTGFWMHEDQLHAEGFAAVGDELYAQSENQILALNGTTGKLEEAVEWSAESAILYHQYPDHKYVSRYNIRLQLPKDSQMRILIEYDSSGVFHDYGSVHVPMTGTVTIPIRPRRCDHLRLRLEGKGDMRLFSITRILEQGSDA